ncbi:hypothetical protein [Nocardia sp. CS682]|uniref:hypothetical protein n=1 Tax=Nocardia sp. CS682 TaxID=1047172 RepID=UPI001074D237|nr:hypothetical protein [Nocardia sp. CS682]QBS43466.1 hypothetical protein DMB37_28515 [Nocardia sp. CS682]
MLTDQTQHAPAAHMIRNRRSGAALAFLLRLFVVAKRVVVQPNEKHSRERQVTDRYSPEKQPPGRNPTSNRHSQHRERAHTRELHRSGVDGYQSSASELAVDTRDGRPRG